MEHAGESRVQLYVGAEMEAYGYQGAATSSHFFMHVLCGAKRETLPLPILNGTTGKVRQRLLIFRNDLFKF